MCVCPVCLCVCVCCVLCVCGVCVCVCVCETGKSQLSPTELLERPSGGIDSYLRTGKVWLSGKKDIAERLLKNTSAKTDVKGFFGGLESKLRGPLGPKKWVGDFLSLLLFTLLFSDASAAHKLFCCPSDLFRDTDKPAEQKPKTPGSSRWTTTVFLIRSSLTCDNLLSCPVIDVSHKLFSMYIDDVT